MIGLFGVLTAAALTCTSMQQGCAPQLETQGLAVLESQELAVPKPRVKPLRNSSVSKQRPAKNSSKSEVSVAPSKTKSKLVLQDDTKKARKKRIPLLIGNYY